MGRRDQRRRRMRDAIESMNDQDLDGRNITVNEAQSRGSGGGGGGGGGFRSSSGAASKKIREVLLHHEEGWFPPPLRSHSFLQSGRPERQRPSGQPPEVPSVVWKLRRVVVVGVEEGSTSSPLQLPMGEDELPPTRLTGQGSIDPGPIDHGSTDQDQTLTTIVAAQALANPFSINSIVSPTSVHPMTERQGRQSSCLLPLSTTNE
ncbi:hypothetical protein Sjap_020981 [Stephania japonica]|uniref:Uncharacterized protein n=1 Tax=Stephania japonica TaxID=461633 RepID=A0AAP0F7A4_9MAGN